MKLSNFWIEDATRPETLNSDELPTRTDVAIVGAGYTGLNAALTLRKAGVEATVLEAETVGWGASGRNGSFCSPSFKAEWETIEKRYGSQMALEFWKWAMGTVAYVGELVDREGIQCDFRRTGMLGLAVKPSHAVGFQRYNDYLRERFGYSETQFLPKEALESEIGSQIYHGGAIFEMCYQLQPAKFVYGLSQAAQRAGAKVVEKAVVTRIERQAGQFLIGTGRGQTRAENVLLATNGYTTWLKRKARNGVLPVGSYMIVTEPLTEEIQRTVSPNGRLFWDSKHYLNYFGLTPDGRAFIGGRANLSPNMDLRQSGEGLHRRLVEIFPQLAGMQITHSWSGKLGVTFDQMPHIGNTGGVYYAYGYSGQGVPMACFLGKEVAELIAGVRQESLFLQIKHPTNPLTQLEPLYLPLISLWFKWLDWVS